MKDPVLHVDPPHGDVRAVALVLHGGRSNSRGPVRPTQLAVLRMRPFITSLRRAGAGHGLAVARLRFRMRGWNGTDQSPVPDTRWALDELAARFPGAPAALVGHSMGGRAAMYAAGHPSVRAVAGLAPWLEGGDPYAQLSGRRLFVAHGDHDHMTSAAESARFVREAATVAESAGYVSVHGDSHAMLRRAGVWHDLATTFVLAAMCGVAPEGTERPDVANAVEKALAGDLDLTV